MAPVPEPPPDLANDDDGDGVPPGSPAEGVVDEAEPDPPEPGEPG